jgi:hypothetical protein
MISQIIIISPNIFIFSHFALLIATNPKRLKIRIIEQSEKWGNSSGSPKLDNKFGGDGDDKIEYLSFGLMVKNSYSGVFCI